MTDLSKRYSSISIRLEDFRHSMYICLRIHRTTALSHFSLSHASSFTHSRLSLQLSHICAPSAPSLAPKDHRQQQQLPQRHRQKNTFKRDIINEKEQVSSSVEESLKFLLVILTVILLQNDIILC